MNDDVVAPASQPDHGHHGQANPRPEGADPIDRASAVDQLANLLQHNPPRDGRAFALGAVTGGRGPRDIYLDLLAPALVEIGKRWQNGTASVAQEHLATAIVASIMATLAPGLEEGPPVRRRIVLSCIEGELHQVGLRMLADFLEGDGWEVLYLGALTPTTGLGEFVAEMAPAAVGLSVTLPTHVEVARVAISAIRAHSDAYILVGGGAFGGTGSGAEALGADGFAPHAAAASALLRDRFGERWT